MTYALIYHDVVPREGRDASGFPGPEAGRYKLDPADFERHLDAIASSGRRVGLWSEQPDVALTFDDGGRSALATADALERRGWRGHFFITTNRVGTGGFLDGRGVRELAERGHVVGSHSHTHPTYMGRMPPPEIEHEWTISRDALGEILGEPPVTASVPGGFLSKAVIERAAAAGYRLLMTSEPTARTRNLDGMVVQGRFSIWSTTPASTAAAYARGAMPQRARLWLEWTVKQRAKRISPRAFETARGLRARRS